MAKEISIGDEVWVHGFVDEIRKDVIIIRNEGGYFGTVPSEVFYYEEDRNGYGTMNTADTPQMEKTCDNCGTPRDKCVYCIEEDRMWTPQDCDKCIWSVCNYNKVDWDADTPQTERLKQIRTPYEGDIKVTPQTDCGWK